MPNTHAQFISTWFENNKGKTFKRPKGKRTYKVLELEEVYYGYLRGHAVRCLTDLGQEMSVNLRDFRKMEEVTDA